MYRLQVKAHFDAAHYIRDYPGKCSRMHGHRWEVEVVLEGEELDEMNILVDFSLVKKALTTLLDDLDHYIINKQLNEKNVTAEFLAKWIWERFKEESPKWYKLEYGRVRLARVTVWEGPDCCVKYSPGMKSIGG